MKPVMIYTRFERFWHWTQAVLIIGLAITGFEIHGSYHWLGFEQAVDIHIIFAWSLIVLWAFAIFWHFTTGQWRHYIPTRDKLGTVIHYYLIGSFRGESHPYRKTTQAKHNPLQRLAYLLFKLIISPMIWISGLLYLYYQLWPALGLDALSLGAVALVHTAAAFLMLMFFIAHVYMATVGKSLLALLKPMITGYEEMEE
jgi:thiosulfate reductase cytochrome b subunit